MKKNLLIAIALAIAFSAYWSCGDAFYDPSKNPNNYGITFQVVSPSLQIGGKESLEGQSIMGVWGYHEDSIRFRQSSKVTKVDQVVSINNSGSVSFAYIQEPWSELKHDVTYSNTLYITYPMLPDSKLPYDGQTDSIKCEYHIVVRKGEPRVDYFKIYYNDSLYTTPKSDFYKFIKK